MTGSLLLSSAHSVTFSLPDFKSRYVFNKFSGSPAVILIMQMDKVHMDKYKNGLRIAKKNVKREKNEERSVSLKNKSKTPPHCIDMEKMYRSV